jgi:magnesium transporter
MTDSATVPLAREGQPAAKPANSQTVAHYLVANVPVMPPDASVAAAQALMAGRRYDDASHIYVVDSDGGLAGVADIADLIAADADCPIGTLAKGDKCHIVTPKTDREDAASMAIRAGASAIAVCDGNGRFLGAMPAAALMSILRDEHLEDLHRMAGIAGRSEAAQALLMESPQRRALNRLPWIVVGLAGSSLITAIMAGFETALQANIAIAFFVPALVYLADAVGTQTEVVAVRTFSLTETSLVRFFATEVATGAIVGLVLAALALPFIWLVFGGFTLGLAVSVALFVGTTVATAVGFVLPWIFDRFGFDPALGSGPIATVFQDALTLLIYFVIAALLLL